MGLFKPIWEKDNLDEKQLEKARKAVAKITDQGQLHDIAAGNGDWRVKMEAVGLMTDQSLLADLANTRVGADVRYAALERIWDRDQLIRVATKASWMQSKDGDHPINMAALDKIPRDDSAAFEAVMLACDIEDVRLEATRRAGDSPAAQEYWENAFANEKSPQKRIDAAEHMSGQKRASAAVQEGLLEIVRNVHPAEVRIRAANLLSDPEKSRQYGIASRLVLIHGYGGATRSTEAALAFSDITDPEVIDFVLDNGVGRDEYTDTALECLYANIDPNSERAFRVLDSAFNRRHHVRDEEDVAMVIGSPEWGLLKRVTDEGLLRRLAVSEEALSFIRFRACEMAGSHDFSGANCACAICGFEDHRFTEGVCERCGSKIASVVSGGGDLWTVSTRIEHADGTTAYIASFNWQNAEIV